MKHYSDWLKIDLHLHTNLSRETKTNDYQGTFSVDTLHSKLTENEVEIFSLTDHNIVNVDAYEEYYTSFTDEKSPLLLVGVELDIVVTKTKEKKTYHSLLIFNYKTIEKARYVSEKLEEMYFSKGLDKKDREITFSEIIDLFQYDDFFFIPHAGNTKSIVKSHKGHLEDAQRMVLLMQSALEKVTKEETERAFNKGFDSLKADDFREKEDIPFLRFSDNHNINEYPATHKGGKDSKVHEFYYIKGSKSYETLRLAFVDPESRIKSPEKYSQIHHHNHSIEKVKIEGVLWVEDTEINFSPHLNVIIGGRSSGKSLLLNILGKKVDTITPPKNYEVPLEKVTIKSNKDSCYKNSVAISDELVYINQGDIVRYFEESNLEELAKKSDKIFEYNIAKQVFSEHKARLEEVVGELLDSYKGAFELGNEKKYELHQITIDNIFRTEYTFVVEDKLITLHDKSDDINQSKELLEVATENLSGLEKQKNMLEISDAETIIIEAYQGFLSEKIELIAIKEGNNLKKSVFLQRVIEKVAEVNASLTSGAQEKERAKKDYKQLKDEIKNNFSKMVKLKDKSNIIEKFNCSMRKEVKLNESVSLALEVEEEGGLKDYVLDSIVSPEEEKSIYMNLYNLLLMKCAIKSHKGNTPEKLQKKISSTLLVPLSKILDNPKDYLEYSSGEDSKGKSPGFNSEKYLEILLNSKSNKLIFIDQPEDNLGNKFITDTLVNIIRKIKFQKQIFLVTHNPAVAVYGDAECIIIAENNSNHISYKQVVLEDKDAQKEICRNLDGGEYIFDNRARKYNIQRILSEGK